MFFALWYQVGSLYCVCYQEGNVVIARVANFLLCTYSKESVGLGMLRAKVRTFSVSYQVGLAYAADNKECVTYRILTNCYQICRIRIPSASFWIWLIFLAICLENIACPCSVITVYCNLSPMAKDILVSTVISRHHCLTLLTMLSWTLKRLLLF